MGVFSKLRRGADGSFPCFSTYRVGVRGIPLGRIATLALVVHGIVMVICMYFFYIFISSSLYCSPLLYNEL